MDGFEIAKPVKMTDIQIANTLIESKLKKNTITQQKLIYLIAERLQIDKKIQSEFYADDLDRFYTIRFDLAFLKSELGIKRYEDLQNTLLKLHTQLISYKKKDEEGIWTAYKTFFQETEFLEDKTVRIKISGTIFVFLTLLFKQGFSILQKETIIGLDSKYSIKMLELASMINQQTYKTKEYELDEFYELLSIPKKMRSVRHLKERYLDPSKIELKDKAKIVFDYELCGKKYTGKGGRPSFTKIKITVETNQVQGRLL